MTGHVDKTGQGRMRFQRRVEVAEVDGHAAFTLFPTPVAEQAGQCLEQGSLAVVDVPCGADDHSSSCNLIRVAPATPVHRPVAADPATTHRHQCARAPESATHAGRFQTCSCRPRRRLDTCGRRHNAALGNRATGWLPLPIMPSDGTAPTLQPSPKVWPARVAGVQPGRGCPPAVGSAGANSATVRPDDQGRGTAQHRFEGGQGQFVDPQGAFEWVLLDLRDQVFAADNQPGLGATQQFVAAEGDDVAPSISAWRTVVRRASPSASGPAGCRCRGLQAMANRVDARVAPTRRSAPAR